MHNIHYIWKTIITGLIGLTLSAAVHAAPVDVTFTTSGTAGNWLLDFSVANNLDAASNIYFFGVELPARDIANSPGNFNPNSWVNWNQNSNYGGSSINYNNVWINGSIASGSSLSGFTVQVTDLLAPTLVNWFAYAYGGNWTGGGNFHINTNPGFEGAAGQAALVPEPATLAIFGLGLIGFGLARRHKQ